MSRWAIIQRAHRNVQYYSRSLSSWAGPNTQESMSSEMNKNFSFYQANHTLFFTTTTNNNIVKVKKNSNTSKKKEALLIRSKQDDDKPREGVGRSCDGGWVKLDWLCIFRAASKQAIRQTTSNSVIVNRPSHTSRVK
ncbi:conserved hypothetical protein [Trichinella spiralis]|uniref:hypothetical protein n=1 Tax=Trichinella spiralis TaxID=6334 RepID=UPI0001EFD66A|nr:conserved hypothetical protein [Trichinella spiralis]